MRLGVRDHEAEKSVSGGNQELIGVVYAPLIRPLIEAAEADVAARREPSEAVDGHIRAAAEVARRQLKLTISLIAAVTDQIVRVGRPGVPDPRNVRLLVRCTTSLTLLVAYWQECGEFRAYSAAEDVSSYHINALLQRVISRREESAEETEAIVLSLLMPTLRMPAAGSVVK